MRIIVCRCAQAKLGRSQQWPTVVEALRAAGREVLEVDDLCALAGRRDPWLRQVAATRGLAVVACHPRAVRWLFHAAGVELPAGASLHNLRVDGPQAVVDAIAAADASAASPADDAAQPAAGPEPSQPPQPADGWVPWFPVIDYSRCTTCRQCVAFCLFGVYRLEDGKARVVEPARCKTNCPACARMCPQVAIIFPKHTGSPIDGAQVGPDAAAGQVDPQRIKSSDVYKSLRQRQGNQGPSDE